MARSHSIRTRIHSRRRAVIANPHRLSPFSSASQTILSGHYAERFHSPGPRESFRPAACCGCARSARSRRSSSCRRPADRRGDAIQQGLAGRMLRAVHEDEIGGAADLDQAAVERAHPRRVAGREAEGDFRGQRRRATTASRSCAGCRAAARPSRPGASVPRITRSSSLEFLAPSRSVNSAARSLPLCTSSRPRLQPSQRQRI